MLYRVALGSKNPSTSSPWPARPEAATAHPYPDEMPPDGLTDEWQSPKMPLAISPGYEHTLRQPGRRASMKRARLSGLLLLILLTSGLFVVWVPQARAGNGCNDNEQYFARIANAGDRGPIYSRGLIETIKFKNRDLDPDCQSGVPENDFGWSGAATLSTGHMEAGIFGADLCRHVEIGWVNVWKPGAASGDQSFSRKNSYTFTEKQIGDCSFADITLTLSTAYVPEDPDDFRIQAFPQDNGTTDWRLWVNHRNGGGYVLKTSYNTSWDFGVATGEAERFAPKTGMGDNHSDLQYLPSGSWVGWPLNICQQHQGTLDNLVWDYDRLSTTEFQIVKHTPTTCPNQ
jgi:hypothetical protein